MKHKFLTSFIMGCMLLMCLPACDIDPIDNPNGPSAEALTDGASADDIRLMASGLESVIRNDMEFYYWTTSTVGREYYDLNGTDPRYTAELVTGLLDNNGFLTTRTFAAVYRAIRTANSFITAVQNSTASFSTEESNSAIGYAETIKAYSLLLSLNRQFENGVRLDTSDPDNLSPFTNYAEGLNGIKALLDDAARLLAEGGDAFPFVLSSGFTGFDTPASMRQFNRAIAARVALYQGNNGEALSELGGSFFNINGSLEEGVYHTFGTAGNDIRNPLFNVANVDLYIAHPSFVEDAEAGDTRVAKNVTLLDDTQLEVPHVQDNLSGSYQVTTYASQTTPVPMINNEELVLIYAEANIGSNNAEAVNAINVIRNAAGLSDYAGGTSDAELTDEVLRQRRYSLFGMGHRWIDMRRFNRLDQLPNDRSGDMVPVQFVRPLTEEG